MAPKISIVIPVGPRPEHSRWLNHAIKSVQPQMTEGDEIVIVDNGSLTELVSAKALRVWWSPWSLGVPVAFNVGVGLAYNEHVLMMGSDDQLLPDCLDKCRGAIQEYDDPLGWYYLGVEYSDGRTQNTPCHASLITKKLWDFTGGFPPESAVGACDTMLISMLLDQHSKKWAGDFHKVSDESLYWWRIHPDMETRRRKSSWGPIVKLVRDVLATEWRP